MVTLFVLFLAVLFYVGYIFPETAKLFLKFDIPLPPMTAATLDFSDFILANPILLTLAIFVPPIIFWRYSKTEKGKYYTDKYMMKSVIIYTLFI